MPPAQVDANQLELAILNLADQRARRHARRRHDRYQVREPGRAGPAQRPGPYPHSVLDTGSRHEDENPQRAIEPFFSSKPLGKGTGLGLSMVHGLAVQLGGALHLSSTE